MRGKWVLFSVSVILIAIAAGALSVLRKPSDADQKKTAATAAQVPPIGDEISAMGKIQAAHLIALPAPTEGTIESWEVESGQEVLEGQLIGRVRNANLESAQEQAQLELERTQSKLTAVEGQLLSAKLESARADADSSRATTELARLERAYFRQQALLKEGATPRLTFEKAEKDYNAAKEEASTAQAVAKGSAEQIAKLERDIQNAKSALEERNAAVEEAKENLESSNILSPADGTIVKLGADPGGTVDRTMQDLVQLATDPALLQVVIEPEARVLERIKPGQPALVIVPDVTSEGLVGEVKEVKGTQVIVEFTSPNPVIKHGMSAGVRIKIT